MKNARMARHLAAPVFLAACFGCTPAINETGQYVAAGALDGKDVGYYGQIGVFQPGEVFASSISWTEGSTAPNNGIIGFVKNPGGDIPATFTGNFFDADADQLADYLDLTLDYSDGHTLDVHMLKTDPYDDYRCWGNTVTPGCLPSSDAPVCSVTPLGGDSYHVGVTVPFKDADLDLNPGGTFGFGLIEDPACPVVAGCQGAAPIPGTSPVVHGFPNGVTVAATGSAEGTLSISTDVTVDPGRTLAKLQLAYLFDQNGNQATVAVGTPNTCTIF